MQDSRYPAATLSIASSDSTKAANVSERYVSPYPYYIKPGYLLCQESMNIL
jgi:hypothetical protein